jgi:Fe-S cluster assembly ATP-binding protein
MLEIKNLHCSIGDTEILKGINLTVNPGEKHAIMGPNGSGKSTLSSIISGSDKYEITEGSMTLFGQSLDGISPEERSYLGVFMSFQYPIEIPGVTVSNFLKTAINEHRKFKKLEQLKGAEILKKMREALNLLDMDQSFLSRSINDGFSGGEKKKSEIFQMAMLKPRLSILDETDSGLDIDALKIVASGVNKLYSKHNSFIIITHYQRLLNYIKPDYVHILSNGMIIRSGDANLALELEEKGYDGI